MVGNIWEWVQDEWHDHYRGAPTDGSGWCAVAGCPAGVNDDVDRVARGGGLFDASFSLTGRVGDTPLLQGEDCGGRLARSIR